MVSNMRAGTRSMLHISMLGCTCKGAYEGSSEVITSRVCDSVPTKLSPILVYAMWSPGHTRAIHRAPCGHRRGCLHGQGITSHNMAMWPCVWPCNGQARGFTSNVLFSTCSRRIPISSPSCNHRPSEDSLAQASHEHAQISMQMISNGSVLTLHASSCVRR